MILHRAFGRLLIAASLGATGSICSAETYFEQDDGWSIERGEKLCMATREYDSGSLLLIGYDPAGDTALLSISNDRATSIAAEQEVKLQVVFVGGDTLDDDWNLHEFNTKVLDNGDRQFIGKFDGKDMLRDLARYDTIAFTIDGDEDKILGAYKLDGSATAMTQLRNCAFAKAGLNPDDPFLK